MIAGFYFCVKTAFYTPNRYKKVRSPVSHFRDFNTHRIIYIYLIFNMFNR
jgi:hypothetical protein